MIVIAITIHGGLGAHVILLLSKRYMAGLRQVSIVLTPEEIPEEGGKNILL